MDAERSGPGVDPNKIGRETEQGLVFKPAEIEYVTRSYRELYRNRQDKLHLDNIASHQERARLRQDEAPQYRPKTTNTTARLADKKRQSIQGAFVP